jgi:hypothetical protein
MEGSMASPNMPAPLGTTWRVAKKCDIVNCVQVARLNEMIVIGDTKNPDGPVLLYTQDEWEAFINGVRHGDFDDIV